MQALKKVLLKRAMKLLPAATRNRLGRRMLRLPDQLPEGLVVKIAETKSELEGAFRLLYDSYRAEGITGTDPSGMRVTKYNLLPTSTTIVAKVDDQVVATVTLIQDGLFGMPMDAAFDLSSVRAGGRRLAEISGLAVAPSFRQQGAMLCLLTKFLVQYSYTHLHLDGWVAAANPRHNYLYESIWNFTRLKVPEAKNYAFANNAPAIPWFADMESWPERLFQAYADCDDRSNLAKFYFRSAVPSLRLPSHPVHRAFEPLLPFELVRYFFIEKSGIWQALSPTEAAFVLEAYGRITAPLARSGARALVKALPRTGQRFQVNCLARATFDSPGTRLDFLVTDASDTGLGATTTGTVSKGDQLRLDVRIGNLEFVTIGVEVAWTASGGRVGMRIVGEDTAWSEYIDSLAGVLYARTPSALQAEPGRQLYSIAS